MPFELSQSETELLTKYCGNILKWNKTYNLVSNSQTQQDIWQRHILDSTQIYNFLPSEKSVIADFGSGGGFPAIPCAIISKERNISHQFFLFESSNKKCMFLEDCKSIFKLSNMEIKNERIESQKNIKADVITARAFAKIDEIFTYASNFMKETTKFILLKGKNLEEEINSAKTRFSFDYKIVNSSTGDGFIFLAKNVKLQ